MGESSIDLDFEIVSGKGTRAADSAMCRCITSVTLSDIDNARIEGIEKRKKWRQTMK